MAAASIPHQRLTSQRIAHPTFTAPDDVVAWLGAMQGQDYAGAKWSVGLRMAGATDALIEQALAQQTIVRTWALRGTLHLVAAADVGWLVRLVAPRLIASNARRYRELELDDVTLRRSTALLAEALQGGARRDRPELLAILQEHGISTAGQRGVYMLQRASLEGLICQSTAPRNTPIFVALDGALPVGRTLDRDQALAELARRYFTSHGPATLKDFIWWSGLASADARAGHAAVSAELLEVRSGEQSYWMAASAASAGGPMPAVYALPGFDEYLLGYGDRSAALDPQYADRIVPGGNGVFYPTIISNGRVVGVWKRSVKAGRLHVTPDLFELLDADELRRLEDAAARYAAFLELPLEGGGR